MRDIFKRPDSAQPGRLNVGPPLPPLEPRDSYLRIQQNIEALWNSLQGVRDSPPPAITDEQLKQISRGISFDGPSPLVLTGLPGVTGSPQLSSVPFAETLPDQAADGQLIFYLNVIYRWSNNGWSPVSTILLQDTAANVSSYSAAAYAPGVLFRESDTGILRVNDGANWLYTAGIAYGNLADLPGSLGAADSGYLFGAVDYAHQFRWDGAGWNFSPGDPGSAYVVAGPDNNNSPFGGLWALCDGNNATVSQGNGNTTVLTTPSLPGNLGLAWWLRR